jgi:dimethylglycine dehydrogenase
MQEFARARGMGRYQGMNLEILSPDEIKDKYPFIETHDLKGALYDPNDGDIDPAQLTQALAKGARDLGATILRFCPATGVSRENGEWIVHTEKGDIRCEIVVNAAGYYAQRVGEWFKPFGGRTVPMMVMSHQYMLSSTRFRPWPPGRRRWVTSCRSARCRRLLLPPAGEERLQPRPLRAQLQGALGRPVRSDARGFQLSALPRRSRAAVGTSRTPWPGCRPGRGGAGQDINGPIPYAPDGNPLIGPMPGVPNAFEACVFTFGIAQGGGAGKVLAEWITEGETEWDMWSCDPRRFTDYTDHDYCVAKGMEVYGHEYGMHFPHGTAGPRGADKKLSPVHDRVAANLARQLGAYAGWERANWFAQTGRRHKRGGDPDLGRAGPWEPRIREECEAVRDARRRARPAGLFAVQTCEGPGARDWLMGKIAGMAPKPGRIGLGLFPRRRAASSPKCR